jgi:hypothetical protein
MSKATIAISSVTIGILLPNPRIRRGGRIIGDGALKLFTRSTSALPADRVGIVRRVSSPLMRTEQATKQTLITTLALGLDFFSLLMAPSAAHAQRYLVNGHPATAGEEHILVSYGFDGGAWRMDGWGISLDMTHADFVPEPRFAAMPPRARCSARLQRGTDRLALSGASQP